MNGLRHGAQAEVRKLLDLLSGELNHTDTFRQTHSCDVVICPPATLLASLAQMLAHTGVALGGQDCHVESGGAHTGDLSAEMFADSGAHYMIVGHSERRTDYGETDAIVRSKAEAVLAADLTPIICVGETKPEREAGQALAVVERQVKASLPDLSGQTKPVVIAYEPVWAIGTGLVPTADDIARMHELLRKLTGFETRLLYGGSVKPGNAAEILSIPDVDGALVGGASLKADDFYGIIATTY